MSRKASSLPDIEDATFLACLDPLAETLAASATWDERVAGTTPALAAPNTGPSSPRLAATVDSIADESPALLALPSLAAWRSQADEAFAEFWAIRRFVAVTDAELATAVQTYRPQIIGFLERISRMQQQRAAQDRAIAAVIARLHAAMLRAASAAEAPQLLPHAHDINEPGPTRRFTSPARHRPGPDR